MLPALLLKADEHFERKRIRIRTSSNTSKKHYNLQCVQMENESNE